MKLKGKKYWIIGASEGLGRELSIQLSNLGVKLIISARNETRLNELSSLTKAKVLALDVLNIDAINQASKSVGIIDGIIYVAGDYTPLNSTTWNVEEVDKMIAVNFTGAAKVLGFIVPKFLKQNNGHIVIPNSRAVSLTMNREGIRNLAAKTLGVNTSKYRFASSEEEFEKVVKEIGLPCVVKPIMSSSGKGQSVVKSSADVKPFQIKGGTVTSI